ncbi:exosome complex exonuclease RRP43 [Colletotrichum karsti]|uniref:Ribosomal RNA-processing protein 43 n=1 Tax=Colletotrichum karsti TaxID=1095194 RepID=A0A9P6II03_9PEZI|nr:exosome complex exonuclease RRP43 [Colletotrichum karsti]KAF9879520.1 exosome complex exonuclease RRP43 [Colletotrichum karsti]
MLHRSAVTPTSDSTQNFQLSGFIPPATSSGIDTTPPSPQLQDPETLSVEKQAAIMATSKGLPRDTFAKLSPHPFLLANLQPPAPANAARSNGRRPDEARIPNINTSSLTHTNGSAVVRTGDTTVICGVRAETVLASDIPNFRRHNALTTTETDGAAELKDYDLLVPNIELATGCAPQFLPGVPPTTLAQTLSTRIYSLLHSAKLVDADDLRIWYTRPAENAAAEDDEDKMEEDDEKVEGEKVEGEKAVIAYWVLYIDIFFISFDGNPFDVAWAAVLAALRDTTIPIARWDPDREMVICSRDEPKPLTLHGFPVACTAGVFASKETTNQPAAGKFWTLVDPDSLEEGLCDETITAVVDRTEGETKVISISKHGGTTLQPQLIREFVGVAERRWEEIQKAMA